MIHKNLKYDEKIEFKIMVGIMKWGSKISFFRKSVGKHKSFLAHDVRKYWWIYTVKTSIWPDQACPNIELQFSEAYQRWICIDSRFKVIRALKKNDQSSKVTSAQSGYGFLKWSYSITKAIRWTLQDRAFSNELNPFMHLVTRLLS